MQLSIIDLFTYKFQQLWIYNELKKIYLCILSSILLQRHLFVNIPQKLQSRSNDFTYYNIKIINIIVNISV